MRFTTMSSTIAIGVTTLWLSGTAAAAQADEPALPCCESQADSKPQEADDQFVSVVNGDGKVLWEGNPDNMPGHIVQMIGANDDYEQFEDDAYPNGGGPVVTSLADSLDPLVEHFNSQRNKKQFVALLSATCPACVFGARAVRDSILEAQPDGDFSLSIVWIDMLPADNQAAASRSARLFNDPRVTQFYDPNQLSGFAFAEGLLNENAGPAWDVYMFFEKDASWGDATPAPSEWYHQLSGTRRADPELFRPHKALVDQLRKTAGRWARSAQVKPKPSYGTVKRASATKEVEFLYIEDCPNYKILRERLVKSLERCGSTCSIRDIDLSKLSESDRRRRFGSPSILFNGRDLFGAAPSSSGALTCRIYKGGASPAIEALCAALCDTVCDTPAATASCCSAAGTESCCKVVAKETASCCTASDTDSCCSIVKER